MAKDVKTLVKLQILGGQANPAPPVGPALGQHGVNIMEFCKAFNAQTQDQVGVIIPAVISIYSDRTFTFITKSPLASVLLKQAATIAKGSSKPKWEKEGQVTVSQVREIAQQKMKDLNALNMEGAIKIIEGSAKSMGIEVVPG